jgi:NitT/TauT family transport system substrate-binding protein
MRLRIGHLSTIYHTALSLQGSGILEKRGIEASWYLYGGGPAIVEAMQHDKIDIGYIGLPPTMIGIAKGAPIKCVAGGHIEGTALITKKPVIREGEEKVIKSLEGERIGSPPKGSIHDIIIRHLLKKHETIAEVENYPWADFIPLAIEDGTVSAAVGTPALAVYLKNELKADIPLSPGEIWPYNPSYGIIAREETLTETSFRDFLEVHEDATNQLNKNPREVAEIAADVMGFIDPGFALEVIALSPHYCASLPPEYIQSTMDFVPVMQVLGYLPRTLTEEEIFYTDAIDNIHGEKSHYQVVGGDSG